MAGASRNAANDSLFYSYRISPDDLGHVKMLTKIFRTNEPCRQEPYSFSDITIETTRTDDCSNRNIDGSFSLEGSYSMFSGKMNLRASEDRSRKKHVMCSEYKVVMSKYMLVPGDNLNIAPHEQLHPKILQALQSPNKHKITNEKLERWFGDFYCTRCCLGGAFINTTIMEIVEKNESRQLTADMQASYNGMFAKVKASSHLSYSERKSNSNAHMSTRIHTEGGDPRFWLALSQKKGDAERVQEKWAMSTDDSSLIPMMHEFRPSWELIQDVNPTLGDSYERYTRNKWKRSEKAVADYLKKLTYVGSKGNGAGRSTGSSRGQGPIPGVKYAIKSVSGGRYLDGRGGHADPLLTRRNPKGDNYLNWTFESVDGKFAIKSVSSGCYLDGRNQCHSNPLLTRRNPKGDGYLQWRIVPVDGNFAIQSYSSKRFLDGRNPQDSNPLLSQRKPNGDSYLQWKLVRV